MVQSQIEFYVIGHIYTHVYIHTHTHLLFVPNTRNDHKYNIELYEIAVCIDQNLLLVSHEV